MGCCINDLRDKEVINVCDGRILGYVDDVEVDVNSGRLVAIVVPCDGKLFGLVKTKNLVILWDSIEKIGDDTILVRINVKDYELKDEITSMERKRRKSFF